MNSTTTEGSGGEFGSEYYLKNLQSREGEGFPLPPKSAPRRTTTTAVDRYFSRFARFRKN